MNQLIDFWRYDEHSFCPIIAKELKVELRFKIWSRNHLQKFSVVLLSVRGEPGDQPDSLAKASDCRVRVVSEPPGFYQIEIFSDFSVRISQ